MADRKADHEHINELETKLENLSKQLENEMLQTDKTADDMFQKAREDRKGLELKHEKTCHEYKSLRKENVELEKEIKSLKVALKSSKKVPPWSSSCSHGGPLHVEVPTGTSHSYSKFAFCT